jgi:hypothetical protein
MKIKMKKKKDSKRKTTGNTKSLGGRKAEIKFFVEFLLVFRKRTTQEIRGK